jgi:hypothetical protein
VGGYDHNLWPRTESSKQQLQNHPLPAPQHVVQTAWDLRPLAGAELGVLSRGLGPRITSHML